MHLPEDSNPFYCITLGTQMSSFAKNKEAPGSQNFFSLQDSTLTCDS